MHKFKPYINEIYNRLFNETSSPHSIALGFATGTVIGMLPTPGFGIILGLLIGIAFKSVNKYALFAGMAMWNFITIPPLYYVSFQIGDAILKGQPIITVDLTFLDHVYHYTKRLLLGNIILAAIFSTTFYFTVKFFAQKQLKKN